MLDAGKLRHRVVVQRYVGEADDYGDIRWADDKNWRNVCIVWAAVDPISGREFYAAEQAQSEVSHKVRMRYRGGIKPGMRLLLEGRKLYIQSVIDWEERHESLLLMVQEVNGGE